MNNEPPNIPLLNRLAHFAFADAEVAVAVIVVREGDFAEVVEQFKAAAGKNGGSIEEGCRFGSGVMPEERLSKIV